MKILYVIGRLGMGGDSVAVLNTLDVLYREGKLSRQEVDFLTHDIGYNADKVGQLKESGNKVIILPGDMRKMGPISYYRALCRAIKENGPYDAIHVHTSMQAGIPLLAAKKAGIPIRICHAHTNSIQRKTNPVSKFLLTPFFRWLIRRTATQKAACGEMAGEFLYHSDFTILKNGIHLEHYENVPANAVAQLKKELSISEDMFVVGHVGRFSDMKNQQFILKIAEQLEEDRKTIFVLVGDGENQEKIKEQAKQKGLNIIFPGRRSDIPVFMRMFDMMLLPSLPGEGFPVTLVEAQAGGCPCFASEHITKEADLGLGLVSFCSLEAVDVWISHIRNREVSRQNEDHCCEVIRKLGFDQDDAANEWYELYRH